MGLEGASPRNTGGKGKGNQARKERQSQSEMRQGSVYCRQDFYFYKAVLVGRGKGRGEWGVTVSRSKRK